ncbi:MAG: hypothetical protein S4CHLAM123_04060 [Chlamydiales bacterium]|nr:hypothetical protein [Chlamydiales bacterium]
MLPYFVAWLLHKPKEVETPPNLSTSLPFIKQSFIYSPIKILFFLYKGFLNCINRGTICNKLSVLEGDRDLARKRLSSDCQLLAYHK